MNRILHLISVLALILSASSCGTDAEMYAFAEDDHIRIQVGGTTQFLYDPVSCQTSSSRTAKTFGAFTDTMSDFFFVEFTDIPSQVGQKVNADMTWTTHDDILSRKNLTFEVLTIKGENIVLWSKTGRIGLCISQLE